MAEFESLVEERVTSVIAPTGTGAKISYRTAHFLRPFSESVDKASEVPFLPISKGHSKWPQSISFNGWVYPSTKWQMWVLRLLPLYSSAWRALGIYDSIVASTYQIRKDPPSVCALVEFWCRQTSSFVFPWGEASVTLEDVFVLGGFPLLGEPVTKPLHLEAESMRERLCKERIGFSRERSKKASVSLWINHFMGKEEERQGPLEHVAFLSVWLSCFVIPASPSRAIGKHVFPIAIHLANGTCMALAPAVLASLYRDMHLMKEYVTSPKRIGKKSKNLGAPLVWAPFQILQLWIWEHFIALAPNPNSLCMGEPRSARWKELKTKSELSKVRSELKLPQNFLWRPYAIAADNWRLPSFYKEKEEWIPCNAALDEELQSFALCLRACKLVGVGNCVETYRPHRVAMQFGLDQHLPAHFPHDSNAAWESYNYKQPPNSRFYVPARLFEADVSVEFSQWRKKLMLDRQKAIKGVPQKEKKFKTNEMQQTTPAKVERLKPVGYIPAHPPGFSPIKITDPSDESDVDHLTLFEFSKLRRSLDVERDSSSKTGRRKGWVEGGHVEKQSSRESSTQMDGSKKETSKRRKRETNSCGEASSTIDVDEDESSEYLHGTKIRKMGEARENPIEIDDDAYRRTT